MDDSTKPLIRISALAKSFADKAVLKGVDLEIARARSTVLIGPSSSGKTVLVKCLLGLIAPDAGRVVVEGAAAEKMDSDARTALADRIGVVFQRSALFDSLPTWENVAFRLLRRRGMSREEARERAIAKMAMFGLKPDVAERYPAEISGGMQKRVALARAFATDPEILVLDAPTDGLDPIMTRVTNELIRRAVERQGATVFSIMGDMEAALEYYDDLAMLYDGRIIWSGTTAAARGADDPRLAQLLSGTPDGPIRMSLRA
jgi:phospholipid/cholesterol/gamma-HCH transport system ATP-binding protein